MLKKVSLPNYLSIAEGRRTLAQSEMQNLDCQFPTTISIMLDTTPQDTKYILTEYEV